MFLLPLLPLLLLLAAAVAVVNAVGALAGDGAAAAADVEAAAAPKWRLSRAPAHLEQRRHLLLLSLSSAALLLFGRAAVSLAWLCGGRQSVRRQSGGSQAGRRQADWLPAYR